MFSIFIILHLLHNAVMEPLEVTDDRQGDLLVIVGSGLQPRHHGKDVLHLLDLAALRLLWTLRLQYRYLSRHFSP